MFENKSLEIENVFLICISVIKINVLINTLYTYLLIVNGNSINHEHCWLKFFLYQIINLLVKSSKQRNHYSLSFSSLFCIAEGINIHVLFFNILLNLLNIAIAYKICFSDNVKYSNTYLNVWHVLKVYLILIVA